MTAPTEEIARLWVWLRVLGTALVLVIFIASGASAIAIISYIETKRPEEPAPIITVVEATDPDILTAKWVIGVQQIEIQNLAHLYEKQSGSLGLALDAVVDLLRDAKRKEEDVTW